MPEPYELPPPPGRKVAFTDALFALRCGMDHEHRLPEREDAPPTLAGPTQIVVDGIEGSVARVELPDGTTADWDLASLPRGVREGDVVRLHVEDGDLEMEVDHQETARRRGEAQTQLDTLNQAKPTGELDL